MNDRSGAIAGIGVAGGGGRPSRHDASRQRQKSCVLRVANSR